MIDKHKSWMEREQRRWNVWYHRKAKKVWMARYRARLAAGTVSISARRDPERRAEPTRYVVVSSSNRACPPGYVLPSRDQRIREEVAELFAEAQGS